MQKNNLGKIMGTITFFIMLIVNFLANYLPINGKTTGEISDSIPILFKPAGYAFSIWGLIYVLLFCFVIYQWLPKQRNREIYREIGWYFTLSNIFNSLWLVLWHYEKFYGTLIVILLLLISLIKIYKVIAKYLPFESIFDELFIRLPFSLYLAWISVATVINVSIVLYMANWSQFGLSSELWTILVIIFVLVLSIYISYRFKDPYFSLVILWALLAIVYNLYDIYDKIFVLGLIGAFFLLLTIFRVSNSSV